MNFINKSKYVDDDDNDSIMMTIDGETGSADVCNPLTGVTRSMGAAEGGGE